METVRYVLHDFWIENEDPRSRDFILISGGLGPLLGIITVYVCLVTYLLPRWMANRKPFSLRGIIFYYNLFNIVSNVYFFFVTLVMLDFGRGLFKFTPNPRDDRSGRSMFIIWMGYLYFWLKLTDLIETVFFVLRKKQSQVSFLHVYHHSAVPIIVWIAFKTFPTGNPAGLFPLLNSAVHVVMYTYYLLSGLGPAYRKYLWWKKYITVMQLAQFVIFIAYGLMFAFYQQGYPFYTLLIPNIQSPIFFVMFYRFFQHTYTQKDTKLNAKEL